MTDSIKDQLQAQRAVIERHRPTPRTDAFIAAQPPVIFNGDERITARAVRDLMIAHAGHARQMERYIAELVKALADCCDTVEVWAPEHRAAAIKRQLAPYRALLAKLKEEEHE
jgi:hypothetical protein